MPTASDTDTRALLVYRSALDLPATAAAFAMLSRFKGRNLRRQLFTTERYDGQGEVKILKIDPGYGTETVELRNVVTQAFGREIHSDLLQDGYDLLCLKQMLDRDSIDGIVLLRTLVDFQDPVQRWLAAPPDMPFLGIGDSPAPTRTTAFRRDHPGLRPLVELGIDLFRTGAVFGLEHYSFDTLLHTAWATARRL